MRAKGVATSITTQLHGDNIMKPTARSLYNQPTRARELNTDPLMKRTTSVSQWPHTRPHSGSLAGKGPTKCRCGRPSTAYSCDMIRARYIFLRACLPALH